MIVTLLFCLTFGSVLAAPHKSKGVISADPWEEFQHAVDLDVAGKYWMFWTSDDETQTITFEVHVEALGYIGFGISPNGGMTGADVVIGWVNDDGTAVFHDRHALGEYEPIIDESQDVTLLSSSQNDTHTILRFSRPYVTCDENDRDITDDTIRVIFSFTDSDPEDITGLEYHGSTNRGTKSVILLSYNDDGQTLPDDTISMDVVLTEHTIPSKKTTYWCEFMQIPQMEQKHHVVMFEPLVQPGNEGLVHHIDVHACYGEMDDDDHGVAWDCIKTVMPNQEKCYTAMFVWAVGGSPFYFPEHTGVPLFSPEDNTPLFFRMEIHYDNPAQVEGVTDHSGIRLHMTPTLREQNVGLLTVGVVYTTNMIVPPHFDELTYRGYCVPQCLETGLNTTDDTTENDQMNIFAINQHSHLLGRKMKTRLYRDGAEMEPLMDDENYDFNYQEMRKLKEERIIHPTDILVVDCGYDSSHKNSLTLGGLATKDEMCLSFVYYYPAHNLIRCLSVPPYIQTINTVDGIEIEPASQYPFFRIAAPPEYVNMTTLQVFRDLDWTNETLRNRYQDVILEENAHMRLGCVKIPGVNVLPNKSQSPELGDDWIDPDEGPCDEVKEKKNLEKH